MEYLDLRMSTELAQVPVGALDNLNVGTVDWANDGSGATATVCKQDPKASWKCSCAPTTGHPPPRVDACEWYCPELDLRLGARLAGVIGTIRSVPCGAKAVRVACEPSPSLGPFGVWRILDEQPPGSQCNRTTGICECPISTKSDVINIPYPDTDPSKASFVFSAPVTSLSIQSTCQQLGVAALGNAIRAANQTLRSLRLVNCSLTTQDLMDWVLAYPLPALTLLDLSHNDISQLPTTAMLNLGSLTLTYLNVSHNRLRSMHNGLQHFGEITASNRNGSLLQLDLSHNQLTSWQRLDGPLVARLQLLNLEYNAISAVGNTALSGILAVSVSGDVERSLRLRMQGNPSTCAVQEFLRENNAAQLNIACNCSTGQQAPTCPQPLQIPCDRNGASTISPVMICDGVVDCPDGIDERSCSTKLTLLNSSAAEDGLNGVCSQPHIEDSELVIRRGVVVLNWLTSCGTTLCNTPVAAMVNYSFAEGLAALSPVTMYRPSQSGTSLYCALSFKASPLHCEQSQHSLTFYLALQQHFYSRNSLRFPKWTRLSKVSTFGARTHFAWQTLTSSSRMPFHRTRTLLEAPRAT